jgi:hypothetical protein
MRQGVAIAAFVLTGCGGITAVTPAKDDTLTVASSSFRPSTGEVELRQAMKAAIDYCSARGLHMHIVDTTSKSGVRESSGRVYFRCVK